MNFANFLRTTVIPSHIWRWGARWPVRTVEVLIVLFIIALIARAPFALKNERSREMVSIISQQHITTNDVLGTNLPPIPNPQEVNATVVGIDTNKNNIRDDVELAIFAKYPKNIKIRAAELQYAMALQMYFTKVFSKGTLRAVGLQTDRATFCLWDAVPAPWKNRSEMTQKLSTQYDITTTKVSDEVKNLVLNTKKRKDTYNQIYNKYFGSTGTGQQPYCDVNTNKLTE